MSRMPAGPAFEAKLARPADPGNGSFAAFVVLPRDVSGLLPRRGRTSVDGTLNGHAFRATLEPDGQLGHWLPIGARLLEVAGAKHGDVVSIRIAPVEQEPEPAVPADLAEALDANPAARAVWADTTTVARVDWIHWVTSAKQAGTRRKRIADACDMLASGKRRVCCFDPTGFYSKAFAAPEASD